MSLLKVFVKSKGRIAALKGSLGLDVMSYKDLAWRLDIEVRLLAICIVA